MEISSVWIQNSRCEEKTLPHTQLAEETTGWTFLLTLYYVCF
jgi:hypothetical protein